MDSSFFVIGVAAGVGAGLMAFIITYIEFVHDYPNRKIQVKFALEAAGFACFLFFALSVLAGFIWTSIYEGP
jgi:hypothetical protein